MEYITRYLLITHILAGIISLIVAPIAMIVIKGGRAHRLWGNIFFWSMTWIFLSALVLSLYKWIPFFLMIAVFSYYNVAIGYRALYLKQQHSRPQIKWYDWLIVIMSLAFNIVFIGWGMYAVFHNEEAHFAYLAIFFSAGGMLLTLRNVKKMVRPADKYQWFYNHIGNMIGGFIASVTAFSVQVMNFLPGMVKWLWPTLVFVPVIIYTNFYYRKRMKEGARLSELVELKR
jgi:hypothetical protein